MGYTNHKRISNQFNNLVNGQNLAIVSQSIKEKYQQYIGYNLTETPEKNTSKIIHQLLQQELGEQCEITQAFVRGYRIISLYDKQFIEQGGRKRAEGQIIVKPLSSGLIDIKLHPYYAYDDHYYHLDKITLEQLKENIKYFQYILKEEDQDKIPHNKIIQRFSYDDHMP